MYSRILCQRRFKILPNTQAFKIVQDLDIFAKVAKFGPIWSHCSRLKLNLILKKVFDAKRKIYLESGS